MTVATPRPDESSWTIGTDRHGRRIRLVRHTESGKADSWSLHREASNQRDEAVRFDLLDTAHLSTIAAIIAAEAGKA